MKSKTCWFNGKLFKNTLKRYWWFGFLAFLTFFFSVSVYVAVLAANAAVTQAEQPLSKALDSLLTGFFMGNQYITSDTVFALAFGAAAGLVFFGYLHNKRQADFFHGQPVSRETQIGVRFLAGCALFAAAYLINLLFALIILLSYGANAVIFGYMLLRLLVMLLAFASLYALSILCAVLTGNPFAHLQAGFILSFGGTLLMYCLYWMAETFLQTFLPISLDGMAYGSLPVYMVWRVATGMFNLWNALCIAVLLCVILALCVWAYRKRPVEFTGGMLAFPKLQPVFRAVLCLLTGTLIGAVFYSVLESVPFCIFGLLLGAFLGHILCQGQFNRSFGGMFTAFVPYAVTAAALCAVTACFMLDVTKFDQYIPAQADVQYVGLQLDGEDSYSRRVFDEMGNFVSSNPLETVPFDDPEVVGAVLDMARAGVGAIEGRKKPDYRMATKTYIIRYTLGDGTQVQRRYEAVPDAAAAESVTRLLRADAYTTQNDLLRMDIKKSGYVNVMTGANEETRSAKDTAEKLALLAALQKDLRENGKPIEQLPIGRIECELYETQTLADGTPDTTYRYLEFSLYDAYTHTLAVLADWGVQTGAVSDAVLENAAYLKIYDPAHADSPLFETEDPAQIRTILQSGQVFNVAASMTLAEPICVDVLAADEEGMSIDEMQKRGYDYRIPGKDIAMETRFNAGSFAYSQYNVLLGGLGKLGVAIG